LVLTGVARAELNIRRSLATIEWDASSTPLSAVARTLDSLGYPSHPFRGVGREAVRRIEDRNAMAGIGVAGALAINVMLASLALYSGLWDGMEAEYARFFRWISLLLTLPALLWPGRVFFTSAVAALRTRTLHMDLPIALALAAGFGRGVMNTLTDAGPVYFDGVAMLVFLLLVGRYLQARGQRTAADSAELLYSLTPSAAHVVGADGVVSEMPAEALLPGQLLAVLAGDSMPADGVVESGHSSMNVSLLTGESRPVAAGPGDRVYAGTLNLSAPVRVRVTEAGESSRLGRLVRQVEESSRRRAPVVLLADRLAGWFTAVVLALAAGVYVVWLRIDASQAMDHAIALLVVTCPCALALATPLAVTAAVGRAARRGIFIKGGEVLEQLARPARIFLDKTGTITEGALSLVRFEGPDWVKPMIVALEAGSGHPIGAAMREGLPVDVLPQVTCPRHVAGAGIAGTIDGHLVFVGKPDFVRAALRGATGTGDGSRGGVPATAMTAAGRGTRTAPDHPPSALSCVWVAVDGALVARAWLGDAVREDSRQAIASLVAAGWDVGILSGDAQSVADDVAAQVGIPGSKAIGGASPESKLAAVAEARRGSRVVMVGDGINDAAAIAAASVGIGVHGGAEASLAVADVYLTRPGLSAVVELAESAARTMRVIRRGIAFSLAYNVVGVGLAVFGLISPLIAAVMMPASSLTVLLGAWRGRTFEAAA
ncbi:MAG TPA: cation-translocating P-type ATPase, partial [Gemmatimonadaceae bacterium]